MPKVCSSAQASASAWVGRGRRSVPAGQVATHWSYAGVTAPERCQAAIAAATDGGASPSSDPARAAASSAVVPSCDSRPVRPSPVASGATRASSSQAPSGDATPCPPVRTWPSKRRP